MNYRPTVLMGDPSEFSIRGGANPHTRTRWGFKKNVDRARASAQWRGLAEILGDLGVRVLVLPPSPEHTGMVYPANAGFLTRSSEEIPLDQKKFILSSSIPSRAAEKDIYREFLEKSGFAVQEFTKRFEGEADFFPAGGKYIFTSGQIENQRFIPCVGWPPYRRVYGFRSDPSSAEELKFLTGAADLIPLTLVRETHYHGDTCLCSFGKKREFLMVYPPALSAESAERLKSIFRQNLLILSEEDGENFSANAFQVDGHEPRLVLPSTATAALRDQIRERGVKPVSADVTEFMAKGGGSVKCLIGDLGPIDADGDSEPARRFREERDYVRLFGPRSSA